MKKALLTIIALLAIINLQAQTSNDEAAKRALQVGHVMQQERVYLHFDNSAYYLGETMWFKAYVSYGNNDRVSKVSKVLYVELVAPEGYVVETKKYKIDEEGCCEGEFELSPLLLSGYYEIRAYTRYMLNWGDEAIFSRVFPIFDKVNGNNWDFKNMLDRKRGFMRDGKWISSEQPDADLKFYPEGGNLVAGLKSNIAYELRGIDGEPINEKITIYADKEILLTTTPEHQGKGVFQITPQKGIKYTAEVLAKNTKEKDKIFKFTLPETKPEGVTIQAQQNSENISFTIGNNYNEEQELAFGILYRGAIGYYKKFNSNEKEKTFTLSPNELLEGVNKAIVFTGRTPLAERCFFVAHDSVQKNDRNTIKLTVKGNNEQINNLSLAPHEKITLNIAREDGKPISSDANLSLAVNDAEGSVSTSWTHNIYTYLLLGSELKGYIPDAAQYFDQSNKNRTAQLDLLMLTNGWTSYDWEKLTQDTLRNINPIEQGITLKGTFFRKNISSFKVGKGREVNLIPQKDNLTRFDIAYDGKNVTTNTFRTDSAGEFIIETNDFYGKRIAALIPQTTLKQNKNIIYAFALDRYFSPKFRLYDYWERNTGKPVEESAKDSLVQINPFEFLLSSVEVVSDAKKEFRSRPPHSEMRFDYLDEWEYAQDKTYLREIATYKDLQLQEQLQELEYLTPDYESISQDSERIASNLEENYTSQASNEENTNTETSTEEKINAPTETTSGIILMPTAQTSGVGIKYIGNMRFGTESVRDFPVSEEYRYSLTAADVITSAMKRHNYNWAYWVQLMVVAGEYSSNSTPRPDNEYLQGTVDAEKMVNFKEFIIRSDIKTREQFENTANYWYGRGKKLDTLHPLQKFYLGFYSQHYVAGNDGADDYPSTFMNQIIASGEHSTADPKHPNYVACFIPYSEQDKQTGLIPDLANTNGSVRYTSIQGYNESKKFYSPDYSTSKPTDKDYRRTLLWAPRLQTTADGELQVELYNSSSCNTLSISITGRDATTLYSNAPSITTRITTQASNNTSKESIQEQKPESDEDFINQKMDPEVEKALAKQHSKAMVYYNQQRYRNSVVIWAELAKYNYPPALRHIAICYKNGTGLKKNDHQAFIFFENAARSGCAESQYELALLYKSGTGCTPNDSLSHTWMRRASLQKEPRAMIEIAKELFRKGGEANKAKAVELFRGAVKSDNSKALYEYAKYIIDNPSIVDDTESNNAINYMRKAATQGEREAQLYMLEHEHNAQNHTEAYHWAKELSLAKIHEGTKRLADYYYNGQGVKRDRTLAKDLYRTAASQGNKEAEKILEEL